ncbi:hypothetical protein SZ64_12480 [Erythrobacter sp. SG61-1L]|uniref:FkbM family methyltransferase n=1 Tax=Erythrobacter sp. SG61-1L TaxID=1603897 RepID=UPI0006C9377C|nr:FkbM family methyltransferase [Erythrobacter sp. SG61-1L]KPL68839.1 hypothetical protein SZ64_12480 [Erythrobacter sp. SG61-1L]
MRFKRGQGHGEAEFQVRHLSHPVIARAGTTDAIAMEYVFGSRSHLPHAPLPKGAVILDLGANVGYAAADFANSFPDARVIALELDSANAALARRNLAAYPNVELVEAGIWSEDGEMTYGGQRADGFAIGKGEKTARTISLATLLDERGIAAADYVKMDIEGAEWELFRHPDWLARVNALSVEVHDTDWMDPVEEILQQKGFVTSRQADHWSAIYASRP